MLSSGQDVQAINPHSNDKTKQIYSESREKIQAAFKLMKPVAIDHAGEQKKPLSIAVKEEVSQTQAKNEIVITQEAIHSPNMNAPLESVEVIEDQVQLTPVTSEESTKSIAQQENPATDESRVKKLIDEFFKVQREFHLNMGRLVESIKKNPPSSYQAKPHLLEETLAPFKILANNPFKSSPSGNDVDDIAHIMSVMDRQNHEFHFALRALADSVSRSKFTSAMLKELQQDNRAIENLKSELGCSSIMVVQGYFDQPMQNLCRYMLLLTTIKQELEKTGNYEVKRMLSAFMDSIESLSPQIKNINENLDSIISLSSIEHVLREMLDLDFIKAEHEAEVRAKSDHDVTPFADKVTLYNRIKFTIDCAYTGKIRIIRNEQDFHLLYGNLLELMKEIDASCDALQKAATSSIYARSSAYAYSVASAMYYTFFSAEESGEKKTPQDELKSLIKKFGETVAQIETVKMLQEKSRAAHAHSMQ